MPKAGVSYEEVAPICTQLRKDGEKITFRRIQTELGGGSAALILAHYQRWLKEQREPPATHADDVKISPTLKAAMAAEIAQQVAGTKADYEERLAEVKQLYEGSSRALSNSEQQVECLTKQLDDERKTAEEKLKQLEQSLAGAQASLGQIEKQFERERYEAHELRAQSADLERRVITAETMLTAAQQRLVEYKEADEDHKKEIVALREELRQAAAKLNEEIGRRAMAEQRCLSASPKN